MSTVALREQADKFAAELLPGWLELQHARRRRLKIRVPSGARYRLSMRQEFVRANGRGVVICSLAGKPRSPLVREASETDLTRFIEYDAEFLRTWICDHLETKGSPEHSRRLPQPPDGQELLAQTEKFAETIVQLPGLRPNMRASGPSGTRYRIGSCADPFRSFTIVALPRVLIYSPSPKRPRMLRRPLSGNLRYFVKDAPALLSAFQTMTRPF